MLVSRPTDPVPSEPEPSVPAPTDGRSLTRRPSRPRVVSQTQVRQDKQDVIRLLNISLYDIREKKENAISEIEQKIRDVSKAENAGNFIANFLRGVIIFGDLKSRRKHVSQCEQYRNFQNEIKKISADATASLGAIRAEVISMANVGELRNQIKADKEKTISAMERIVKRKLHWLNG